MYQDSDKDKITVLIHKHFLLYGFLMGGKRFV